MKRFLLDTHVLLWWLGGSPELGPRCKELIADQRNQVYVSAATTWEISIKKAIGKLEAPNDIDSIVEDEGFSKLPISLYSLSRNYKCFCPLIANESLIWMPKGKGSASE